MSNEIEDIFKQKFQNFTSTPSEGLFEAIIAKRAKKRKAIWIWSAVALLFTIGSFTFYNFNNSIDSNVPEMTQNNSKSSSLEIKEDQKTNVVESPVEVVVSNDPSIAQFNNDLVSPTLESIEISDSQKDEVKIVQQGEPQSYYEPIAANNNNRQEKPDANEESESNRTEDFAKLFAELESNGDTKSEGVTMFIKDSKYHLDEIPNQSENDSSKESEDEERFDVATNTTNSITPDSDASNEQSPDKSKLMSGPNELSKWRIELSSGLGIAGRHLSGNQEYISKRNNSENAEISYAFDIRAGYQFLPMWNLQMGLNAAMRNESFVHQLPNTTTTTTRTENREETIIHPVFGVITRKYEVEITETEEVVGEKTNYTNKFTQITVPVEIEGTVYRANNLTLMVKSGLLVGLNSNGKGRMLTEEGVLNSIQELEYKKSGIHSMNFGIGIGYDLSPKATIIMYPQARYALNSSFSNRTAFNQREMGIYSHIGLRKKL
ncbi:MAG: hypothetical protein ACPGYY_08545 [Bacteroidia bacterium]